MPCTQTGCKLAFVSAPDNSLCGAPSQKDERAHLVCNISCLPLRRGHCRAPFLRRGAGPGVPTGQWRATQLIIAAHPLIASSQQPPRQHRLRAQAPGGPRAQQPRDRPRSATALRRASSGPACGRARRSALWQRRRSWAGSNGGLWRALRLGNGAPEGARRPVHQLREGLEAPQRTKYCGRLLWDRPQSRSNNSCDNIRPLALGGAPKHGVRLLWNRRQQHAQHPYVCEAVAAQEAVPSRPGESAPEELTWGR